MNLAITIFDIAMMTLVSWVFLKKPLEEKDIEGGQSLLVRIVIGIVAGGGCQLYDELIRRFLWELGVNYLKFLILRCHLYRHSCRQLQY